MQQDNHLTITIITVCYNRVQTLERAIKSVLGQQYKNIEYIIIDGGSTDNTISIIEKYKDKLAFWCSERDEGIYNAMNKGIAHATGHLIAFLNSDDWYADSTCIGDVAEFFKKTWEMADILSGRINLVYKDHQIVACHNSPEALTDLPIKMSIRHPASFVKRSLFEKYGCFDESYRIAADYEWMLRVYRKGALIRMTDRIFTNFSMTGISSTNCLETAIEARRVAEKYAENHPEYLEEIKKWFDKLQLSAKYQNYLEKYTGKIKEMLLAELGSEEVYIFGAGVRGGNCYLELEQIGIKTIGFIDNDPGKSEFCGKRVIQPTEYCRDGKIIISVKGKEDEIRSQLVKNGIQKLDIITYENIKDKILSIG